MRKGRIDYRMARRALLRDVESGLRSRPDVCDAHPDLIRAGRNIGSTVEDDCPICDEPSLRHVTYVFGGRGGRKSDGGRAVRRETLRAYVERHGDCNVYTVEVCPGCHWHHLIESFWLLPPGKAAG